MEKRKFSVMQIIATAVLGLFLLGTKIYIVLSILLANGINFYFEAFSSDDICNYLRIVLVILFPVTMSCLLFGFLKKVWVNVLISAFLGIMSFIIACGVLFGTPNHIYYEYTSPDGMHELVFQENVYFMIFDVDVYEKTSENVMRKIGSLSEENFYPYDLSQYEVEWRQEGFSIKVYDNGKPEILDYRYCK